MKMQGVLKISKDVSVYMTAAGVTCRGCCKKSATSPGENDTATYYVYLCLNTSLFPLRCFGSASDREQYHQEV